MDLLERIDEYNDDLIIWGFRELERFGISVYILMIVGFFNYMSFYDK